MLLNAKDSGVSVDIFLPEGTENLKNIIDKVSLYLQRTAVADRSSSQLQVKHGVCATSRKRFMKYEMVYFVDIKISFIVPTNVFLFDAICGLNVGNYMISRPYTSHCDGSDAKCPHKLTI